MQFKQHIARLFVAHGGTVTLDTYGLPIFPGKYYSNIEQAEWMRWQEKECIVLLGDPGLGKTVEFEFQNQSLRNQGDHSFLLRIKNFYSGCTLEELIDISGAEGWNILKNNPNIQPNLFLDSLDEARLDCESALKEIVGLIRKNFPYYPPKLRLSCRIRDWKTISDKNLLGQIYPDNQGENGRTAEGVTVLELLGLHEEGIYDLANKNISDVDDFFNKAQEFKILQLCSHPLLLEFLLTEFNETSSLASTRTEVYQKALARMLKEENPIHGEHKKNTTPGQRRCVAEKLALLSVLSGYDSVFIPDIDTLSQNSLDSSLTGEPKDTLIETLGSKIFTGARAGEFRFYHRSLAEFLAAEFINKRLHSGMSFLRIRPLLFAANQGIPTPLRGTVSWLAAFNETIRDECVKYDPTVVLEGDLASYDRISKEKIIQDLVIRYKDRNWQRQVGDFGELACGCDESLLRELLTVHNSSAVRVMSLDMIAQGHIHSLFDDILNLAMDTSEEESIRRKALSIIVDEGTDQHMTAVKSLLYRLEIQDPDDQMAGIILTGLVPESLTIDEALDALHEPKNPDFIGNYHMFWHYHFEKRLADNDLEKALHRLYQMISEKDDKFWSNYKNRLLPELFTKLFARYLNCKQNIAIETLGPWFALFSGSLSIRQAADEDALKKAEQWLIERDYVKRDLLRLALKNNLPSDNHRFNPWTDIPFPEMALVADDFDWLCHEAEISIDDWHRLALFDLAFLVWTKGNFLPISRFERIAQLSQSCAQCKEEWQRRLSCRIDDKRSIWRKRQNEKKEAEQLHREKNRLLAQQKTQEIQRGSIDWLKYFSDYLIKDGGIFSRPDFSILEADFGVEVRIAAERGYSCAWRDASIQHIEKLWVDNSIPWQVIVISHALEAEWFSRRIDWNKISPAQIEAAAYIAIRHHSKLPEWFVPLYHAQKIYIERFFDRIMAIEADSQMKHPDFCIMIKHSEKLKPELYSYVVSYLLKNPPPKNQDALDSLLNIAVKQRHTEACQYFSRQAIDSWDRGNSFTEKELRRAMSFLVAWWYMDWQYAWKFLLGRVFCGQDKTQNILAFVGAVRRVLTGNGFDSRSWPLDMDIEANATLVPFLYQALPPEEDPVIYGSHEVGVGEQLRDIRNNVVNHMTKGGPQKARQFFLGWIKDPLFKKHRDWFLSIIDDLERRLVDEQWKSPTPENVAQVFFRDARMIRNENDLFTLLIDLLNHEMREKLADQTSLVPLLWEGAKAKGRIPKDEKPLQQILANQIALLLKGMPTVFAREPEVFDAKKPDFRVSVNLPEFGTAHVPIEVKQAHAAKVWLSPIDQLLGRYMKERLASFGIYLVGWYGFKSVIHPETGERFSDPAKFQDVLQSHVDGKLHEKTKQIAAFVYDVQVT